MQGLPCQLALSLTKISCARSSVMSALRRDLPGPEAPIVRIQKALWIDVLPELPEPYGLALRVQVEHQLRITLCPSLPTTKDCSEFGLNRGFNVSIFERGPSPLQTNDDFTVAACLPRFQKSAQGLVRPRHLRRCTLKPFTWENAG